MIIDALSERMTGHANRVMIGLNWTLVEGPTGIGLAHTPVRGTSGCYGLSNAGELSGKPLSTFAVGLTSANPFDRALALAAINAHHNNFSLTGSSANGIDVAANQQNKTVVIGRFPGIRNRLPEAKVIERNPGPHDFPIAAAPELLADAKTLLITASTLTDGSLSKYLALAPDAFTVLMGPGTPLSPSCRTAHPCASRRRSGRAARHCRRVPGACTPEGRRGAQRIYPSAGVPASSLNVPGRRGSRSKYVSK